MGKYGYHRKAWYRCDVIYQHGSYTSELLVPWSSTAAIRTDEFELFWLGNNSRGVWVFLAFHGEAIVDMIVAAKLFV